MLGLVTLSMLGATASENGLGRIMASPVRELSMLSYAPALQRQSQTQARIVYPASHMPRLAWPDGGSRPVRSLLQTPQMRHGDYLWDDGGVPQGAVWIHIDLARQLISVFRAGHEIGTAVILFGAGSKPTPAGVYPILARAERHRSNLYQADMPYMLRLTGDGIAIHASDVRQGRATHGCIGVPLAFAQRLFRQVRRGDLVAVVGVQQTGSTATR
jgi:hypothetical protein